MWQWLKNLFKMEAPKTESQDPKMAQVGPKALDLILEFEGIDQPDKRPPGASGITIGYGYDLGYVTKEEFRTAWEKHFSKDDFNKLLTAIGKTGSSAESIKSNFRNVKRVTTTMAREVFDRCTLPKWKKLAASTFPGLHIFTPNQQGVLVSLVFNRGTELKGSRRTEMKNIHDIILTNWTLEEKVKRIVNQFRAMQRVWPSDSPSSGHPGLRRRRRAEADLFEKG